MSAQIISLGWEPIRRIDSSTLSGSYQAIGMPLANAARSILFCNNSTNLVTISIDGINDFIDFVAGACFMFDIASDKEQNNQLWQDKGTQFYAKGTAGTGSFCITSFF